MAVYARQIQSNTMEPPPAAPYPPCEWETDELCHHVAELMRESMRTGQPVRLSTREDRQVWDEFEKLTRRK